MCWKMCHLFIIVYMTELYNNISKHATYPYTLTEPVTLISISLPILTTL